jgi:hypothetical protein
MTASELQRTHAAVTAERDNEIAAKQELEARIKAGQRVYSAIRTGRDPYRPTTHEVLAATARGAVDGELEQSRRRSSQAYSTEVIAPIEAQLRQIEEKIRILGESAARVWAQLETEHPEKAEAVFLKQLTSARTAVAESGQKLAALRERQARQTAAKLDAEHATERYRLAAAEALAEGRPLPEPPTFVEHEHIDPTAFRSAEKLLAEADAKARRELDQAEAAHRAYRKRTELRRAESLAGEVIEKARNLGVPLGLLVETLSREVRS